MPGAIVTHRSCHLSLVSNFRPLLVSSFLEVDGGVSLRYFVENPSVGICLMFLSRLHWGYGFWGEEEVKCHFYHTCQVYVLSAELVPAGVDRDHLAVLHVRFLRSEVRPHSFPHGTLWKEIIIRSPHLRCWAASYISVDPWIFTLGSNLTLFHLLLRLFKLWELSTGSFLSL